MINDDFDRIFRDKLCDCTESVGDDVWAGIEGSLRKRSRSRVIRRTFAIAASAAASLVAGLFLLRESAPQTSVAVADSSIRISVPAQTIEEPLPIREQIQSLGTKMAYVKHNNIVRLQDAIQDNYIQEESVQPNNEVSGKEISTTDGSAPASQRPRSAVEEKKSVAQAQDAIDAWWDEAEQDNTTRHTSLSINSNIGTIASKGSFVADFGPSHSASQTGKSSASSSVTPVSEPVFSMPLSFGAQVKFALWRSLYLGVGVNYTYLESSYEALIKGEKFQTSSQLHYVGIPVNLSYSFVDTDKLGVYVSAGFMADKCVKSRYVFGSNTSSEKISGMQYSATLGVGIEYNFIDRMGIYFDPGFAYFFDNSQPLSIRTAQPLQARFEAGLRFNL